MHKQLVTKNLLQLVNSLRNRVEKCINTTFKIHLAKPKLKVAKKVERKDGNIRNKKVFNQENRTKANESLINGVKIKKENNG